MEFNEIVAKLGVDANSSQAELIAAATQKLNKVQEMAARAPTPELRSKYEAVQAEMQQIITILSADDFVRPPIDAAINTTEAVIAGQCTVATDSVTERQEPVISALEGQTQFQTRIEPSLSATTDSAAQASAASKAPPVAPASSPLSQTKLADLPQFGTADVEAAFQGLLAERGWGMGGLMLPFRIVLTGTGGGPSMFDFAAFLGQTETLQRLQSGLARIEALRAQA